MHVRCVPVRRLERAYADTWYDCSHPVRLRDLENLHSMMAEARKTHKDVDGWPVRVVVVDSDTAPDDPRLGPFYETIACAIGSDAPPAGVLPVGGAAATMLAAAIYATRTPTMWGTVAPGD